MEVLESLAKDRVPPVVASEWTVPGSAEAIVETRPTVNAARADVIAVARSRADLRCLHLASC